MGAVNGDAFGLDIGGVLIERTGDADHDDRSFWGPNFLETPEVEGAMDTIAQLGRDYFGDRVYVISTCGEWTEDRTREWLSHNRFTERTGVALEHVHFTRERAGKEPIATRLGITHFVDDRLEVLSYLADVKHRFLFQPRDEEVRRHEHALDDVVRVESWAEIYSAILR